MIVKNEELFLPACLKSVKAIADEMIIVDTGSNDKTKVIANQYGCRVHDFQWCDDFSAARNYALSLTTKDWILMLDADHILEEKEPGYLKKLLQRQDALAYLVKIYMYLGEYNKSKEKQSQSILFKLFRNHLGICYKGLVHEQNWQSIQKVKQKYPEYHTYDSDIIVHHYGYTKEGYQRHNPLARNKKLLLKALEKDNLSLEEKIYYNINLAEILKLEGKKEDSKTAFTSIFTAIKQTRKQYLFAYPITAVLFINLSEIYLEENNATKAKEILKTALNYFPKAPIFYYYLGQAHLREQNYRMAYPAFYKCIRFGENNDYDQEISFNPGILGTLSFFGMALCNINMGALNNAREMLLKCLNFDPDFTLAQKLLKHLPE